MKTKENLRIIRSKVRTHNQHNAHVAPSLWLERMQAVMIRRVSAFIIVITLSQSRANPDTQAKKRKPTLLPVVSRDTLFLRRLADPVPCRPLCSQIVPSCYFFQGLFQACPGYFPTMPCAMRVLLQRGDVEKASCTFDQHFELFLPKTNLEFLFKSKVTKEDFNK